MLKAALLAFLLPLGAARAGEADLRHIRLPAGYAISLYSDDVPGARSLALGPKGTVFVGSRRPGRVYALTDADGDGKAETVRAVAKGLNQPNGVAFKDGALYVAEISRVLRFPDVEASLASGRKPDYEVVADDLPKDRAHGWKFIAFGPDGKLYVPVGAPCNICLSEDPRYAAILRMDPATGRSEVYASGVRNTVGFAWHPTTQELWFTDNGRDWLGDDAPPDELNRAPKEGLHFGYPFCHGGVIPDPEFGAEKPCRAFTPPARALGPHVAALGMRFYRGDVYIAEHGSWNRSQPIGYRVMRVPLKDGKPAGYEVFAEGWLHKGRVWGRPVDLLELPDGSLLVSDDEAGAVYRIVGPT